MAVKRVVVTGENLRCWMSQDKEGIELCGDVTSEQVVKPPYTGRPCRRNGIFDPSHIGSYLSPDARRNPHGSAIYTRTHGGLSSLLA
jgi:hypothetical protein